MVTKIGRKCEVFDKLCDILNRSAKLTCDTFANGIVMCYTAKNGRHRKEPVYEKERVLAGTVLLAASSALCLRLMKKVGERLKKQQEKAKETNK